MIKKQTGTTYVDKRTGEIYQGNNPFFQFYQHNFKLIRWMMNENPAALKLFLWLVEHMDGKNAIVVSQPTLAEALSYTTRTIQRAIKFLRENECIAVLKSGNTNVYAVNADIVWTNTHEKKKFALFDSKVYLSWNEQNQDETLFKTELLGHAKKVKIPSKINNPQRNKEKPI